MDPTGASSARRFIPRSGSRGSATASRASSSGRRCRARCRVRPTASRTADGAVARQAARFRVYGLDADGLPVRELTASEADIAWHVNVANSKAAWYEFDTAFDIPGAAPADLRNAGVRDRSRLVVAPGERSVRGAAAGPVALDGSFQGEDVRARRADDRRGRAAGRPSRARARRTRTGRPRSRRSRATTAGRTTCAMGSCTPPSGSAAGRSRPNRRGRAHAPPNYGPAMATGFITLYDAVRSALVDAGHARPRPGEPARGHPAALRAPRRHPVGQRGLLPRERVRERRRVALGAHARAPRGSPAGGVPARVFARFRDPAYLPPSKARFPTCTATT